VKYDGVLLGVGGHMHDYGRQIVLEDASRKETVATLDAKSDAQGHLESVPVRLFVQEGGYKFAKGDVLESFRNVRQSYWEAAARRSDGNRGWLFRRR